MVESKSSPVPHAYTDGGRGRYVGRRRPARRDEVSSTRPERAFRCRSWPSSARPSSRLFSSTLTSTATGPRTVVCSERPTSTWAWRSRSMTASSCPVIHDAEPLFDPWSETSSWLTWGSRRAANKLSASEDEIQGGTFTLNNTGWFGSVFEPAHRERAGDRHLVDGGHRKAPRRHLDAGRRHDRRPPDDEHLAFSFDHRATDGAQIGRASWLTSRSGSR